MPVSKIHVGAAVLRRFPCCHLAGIRFQNTPARCGFAAVSAMAACACGILAVLCRLRPKAAPHSPWASLASGKAPALAGLISLYRGCPVPIRIRGRFRSSIVRCSLHFGVAWLVVDLRDQAVATSRKLCDVISRNGHRCDRRSAISEFRQSAIPIWRAMKLMTTNGCTSRSCARFWEFFQPSWCWRSGSSITEVQTRGSDGRPEGVERANSDLIIG